MDFPAHILDTVQTNSAPPSPADLSSSRAPSKKRVRHGQAMASAQSSAEDLSLASDSDMQDRDYQTDDTSPASSEQMEPDDPEVFRDREVRRSNLGEAQRMPC